MCWRSRPLTARVRAARFFCIEIATTDPGIGNAGRDRLGWERSSVAPPPPSIHDGTVTCGKI